MKCPNCEFPRAKYLEKRKESKKDSERTNFNASCSNCGWTGELK